MTGMKVITLAVVVLLVGCGKQKTLDHKGAADRKPQAWYEGKPCDNLPDGTYSCAKQVEEVEGSMSDEVYQPSDEGYHPMPSNHLALKQAYLRTHKCSVYGRVDSDPILRDDGTIDSANGWTDYLCSNGVRVIINHNETVPAK